VAIFKLFRQRYSTAARKLQSCQPGLEKNGKLSLEKSAGVEGEYDDNPPIHGIKV
jgi:hypothetical protein